MAVLFALLLFILHWLWFSFVMWIAEVYGQKPAAVVRGLLAITEALILGGIVGIGVVMLSNWRLTELSELIALCGAWSGLEVVRRFALRRKKSSVNQRVAPKAP